MRRFGFVSNSSSSSFIVVTSKKPRWQKIQEEQIYVVGEKGETLFRWGPDVITNIHSKINFAYGQIDRLKYLGDNCIGDYKCPVWEREDIPYKDLIKKYKKMLNKVIKEYLPDIHKIDLSKSKDIDIDHQSSAEDTNQNLTMFKSEELLKRFLFDSNVKLVLDNDNECNFKDAPISKYPRLGR